MSAPAAPSLQLNSVYPSDGTVKFSFYTTADVQGADIDIYNDGGTLVYTGAAAGIGQGYAKLWTLDVPVSYFGTAGNTYDVTVHVFNDDGDAYAYASLAVYDRPQVTLTPAEGATITDLPLTVLWSVTDPTGVSAQVLRVYGTSGVVYATDYSPALALSTSERSRTIGVADQLQPLANGQSYSVRITVTNGVGFSTTVTHSISVSWLPPGKPTATATTDPDSLAVSVSVTAGASPPATDTLMVVRVNADGTRHVLADDLESGDTVTDPLPPLGVGYVYEVTGIAATGVPSEPANVSHTAESWAWAFNFGANAEETLLIDGNPRVSWTLDQGGAAYHFADGGAGGGRPVWYGTTDRDEGGTISFATTGTATTDRLRALCDAHGTGWIRDPFGRRWYAHMWPKFDYGGGNLWNVTISWDAMRFVEV